MRLLILLAFILLPIGAWSANCSFSNPTACGSPGMNNLAVGGNQTIGGTLNISGAATMSGGGTLTGTFSGSPTMSGKPTFGGGIVFTNQTTGPGITISGSNTTLSNANLIGWLSGNGFIGGTLTGANSGSAISYTFNDKIASTATTVSNLFNITHNVAPNANTASGNRVTANFLQNDIGASQGGAYTNTGINQVLNAAMWVQTNESGTSSLYQGAHTTYGAYCRLLSGATFIKSCAAFENDLSAASGSSYLRNTQGLFVHLAENAVLGSLGPDLGLVFADQSGTTVTGYKCLLCLGAGQQGFPAQSTGSIVYADATLGGVSALSSGIDVSEAVFSGCDYRAPFSVSCPITASAITGATRLTSDGSSASSFVYDALITARGTSFTTQPTATVTGCSGAVIGTQLGAGSVLGNIGVNTPGTSCAAESTLSISGGGGSGATGKLVIAGNTLNFPINSTVNVSCSVAASSLNHSGSDSIGWHIVFGATMGTTASTTAIVGSPTWTQDYATASAASHISISSPSADTSLGAINLTITPSSGTWDVGGRCSLTKSAQT